MNRIGLSQLFGAITKDVRGRKVSFAKGKLAWVYHHTCQEIAGLGRGLFKDTEASRTRWSLVPRSGIVVQLPVSSGLLESTRLIVLLDML